MKRDLKKMKATIGKHKQLFDLKTKAVMQKRLQQVHEDISTIGSLKA
jgi:hypothetical protein